MKLALKKNWKIDKARAVQWIAVGVTLLGIVVAAYLSVWTYNHRYDASAEASTSLKFEFTTSQNVAVKSFTASAGSLYYGYWQDSGKTPVKYTFYYKKNSKSSYSRLDEVTIYSNDDYTGDYKILTSKNSQKYDFKVTKMSQKSKKSVARIDLGVY